MDQPLISVIIPVFNSGKYLQEAIESVIVQSYSKLQIIILDDCSDDDSVMIAKSFLDPRIVVYESTGNKDQSYQLNMGIAKAKGEFISIMHSDDVMHKDKLKEQLLFFQEHPLTGICGCNVQYIGEKKGEWLFPKENQDCKDLLLSTVPFAHSTVVFRKSILQGVEPVYNLNMAPAEDYDLWVRLADKTDYGNVQQILLSYRIHAEQLGEVKKHKESILVDSIRKKLITLLFKIHDETDAQICFKTLYHNEEVKPGHALKGVILLWRFNKKSGLFSNKVLKGRLKHIVYKSLSRISASERLKVVITNLALIKTGFLKTVIRSFINPQSIDF